ncbi:TetR family transcriptional regulator C-terminal domain-containing protein [Flavobacterium psychrotolerans]|uniref:Heat-shock protein n=1 Tax=Flavobacterium psychrotolerans TaxID=2169410 RepID=A0A2U1JHK3_9FLAO|nr:TetR family transcriptional regulator C-terminal domain-containing protein [Flavobacterium psychrotolerans]PWA04607.1 heat-shock protein [Flavobacterium psychrotolerans]
MATAKKATTKKDIIDDNQIISYYMDSVLENNQAPKNVFLFCKDKKIDEADFYSFFGSFRGVKQAIWVKFFENAVSTIEKEEGFSSYTYKNKMLTLYFTLFEILTLNRSYVIYALEENQEGLKNLKDLTQFRDHFKSFIVEIIETNASESVVNLDKIKKPLFSEGAWIQFLFILKFWMEDTSKSFEKTDIVIEKSVNTVVDLLDTKPLESLFDLGKFLWKERKM